jgi:hypothetical protein
MLVPWSAYPLPHASACVYVHVCIHVRSNLRQVKFIQISHRQGGREGGTCSSTSTRVHIHHLCIYTDRHSSPGSRAYRHNQVSTTMSWLLMTIHRDRMSNLTFMTRKVLSSVQGKPGITPKYAHGVTVTFHMVPGPWIYNLQKWQK